MGSCRLPEGTPRIVYFLRHWRLTLQKNNRGDSAPCPSLRFAGKAVASPTIRASSLGIPNPGLSLSWENTELWCSHLYTREALQLWPLGQRVPTQSSPSNSLHEILQNWQCQEMSFWGISFTNTTESIESSGPSTFGFYRWVHFQINWRHSLVTFYFVK